MMWNRKLSIFSFGYLAKYKVVLRNAHTHNERNETERKEPNEIAILKMSYKWKQQC